ncbi:MAG: FAD-dependent oxidoreductase [Actinomycetota bacterium]|nr:FAD-dependent oxidoreductase [Actinomycetota bacterium]
MSSQPVAEQARVVVIGGGIAGCSALYHLALMGCTDVLLLERDELTSGSTWHAAGNVPTYSTSWSIMQVQSYSAALYRDLAADPEFPISYHVTGSVRLAHSHERMAEFRHVASMANAQGMGYDMLTPEQLIERYPLVRTHDLVGALWDPLDGDIDPSQVTHALARAARALGARVRRFERVVGLVQQPNHHWTVTVVSNDGRTGDGQEHTVDCEIVVNAAGYRAGEVMALLGRHHPIAQMSHQYYVTDEIAALAALDTKLPLLRDPDTSYYLRQERNSFILGPYEWKATAMWRDGIPEQFANMLWPDDLERLEQQILDAGERVPVLGEAGIARVVNGPIPYAPDGNPYLGPERGLRNFFHCNTFSFGIAQGGGAGKAIAEWILHGRPAIDLWGIDRRRYKEYATTQYTIDKAIEVYQNEYAMGFPFEERPAGRPAHTSPLYETLKAKGAYFGARGGWERPTWFDTGFGTDAAVTDHSLSFFRRNGWRDQVAEECSAVRHSVAVLDLPGFSKFEISGPGAAAYLDHLLCTKLPKVGRVGLCYALLPDGKVLSELTISRLADDHFYAVGAASAEWHDLDVLEAALPPDGPFNSSNVAITNVTGELGSLIVVGPRARDVLAQITATPLDNTSFPWMSVRDIETVVGPVRALRVNYVGELGWELHAANHQLVALYDAIWAAGAPHGIRDFGIYAVDSLRLDKCYRGWKQDLEIGFSPFDASLERFVDLTKPDFVGKAALVAEQAAGPAWRFVPMTLDEPGEADAPFCASIFDGPGPQAQRIGIVTSGGWSFTLGQSVALGYVRPQYAAAGTAVHISVFGEMKAATVGGEPLYDPTNQRLRA